MCEHRRQRHTAVKASGIFGIDFSAVSCGGNVVRDINNVRRTVRRQNGIFELSGMMIAYTVQKRRRFAPLHRERREPFRTGHAVIFTASAGTKHHLSKIVNQAAPAGKQCIGLHAVPSFCLTSPYGDVLIPSMGLDVTMFDLKLPSPRGDVLVLQVECNTHHRKKRYRPLGGMS